MADHHVVKKLDFSGANVASFEANAHFIVVVRALQRSLILNFNDSLSIIEHNSTSCFAYFMFQYSEVVTLDPIGPTRSVQSV